MRKWGGGLVARLDAGYANLLRQIIDGGDGGDDVYVSADDLREALLMLKEGKSVEDAAAACKTADRASRLGCMPATNPATDGQ
jgi:cold shock CspA family protein